MANAPITKETMEIYITVLEKQVSQMTLVVSTLEELNDKLEKVEGHFHNGFRSDITEHVTEQVSNVMEKTEKGLTTTYLIESSITRVEELDNEIKDKIGGLKGDIAELKSAIKIDNATNLI